MIGGSNCERRKLHIYFIARGILLNAVLNFIFLLLNFLIAVNFMTTIPDMHSIDNERRSHTGATTFNRKMEYN